MPFIAIKLKKILNYFMTDTTHTPTMRINLAQSTCVSQLKPITNPEHVSLLRINLIQKNRINKPSLLFPLLFRKTAKLFNEKEKKINRLMTSLKTAQAVNCELRMENEKFATLNEYLVDKNISEEMTNALRAKQEERDKLRVMGEVRVLNQEKQQLIQAHSKEVRVLNQEKQQLIQDSNKLIKRINELENDLQEQNQLFLQFLESNSCTHYERTAKIEITQLRRKIQILESNKTR